jgi:hypothetical protein
MYMIVRTLKTTSTPILLWLLFLLVPCSGATLVRDGKAVARVALPPDPTAFESLAANELIEHVAKMSGARLETITVDAPEVEGLLSEAERAGVGLVCIGRNVSGRLAQKLAAKASVRGAFVLQATAHSVLIAGIEEGPAYAVSELLEQQGVRWFMPGDLGTVIPPLQTITVAPQETVQAPSFAARWMQMPNKDWQVRVRCGGETFPSAHGLPAPKAKMNATTGQIEPPEAAEYYSLVKGARTPRQHCLSNPKLLEYVVAHVRADRQKGLGPVIGMGPNDGAGFCECENCRALDGGDFDPFSSELSVTDRYVWFFNQVLAKLGDEHRDTRIAFYIYHSYMRPPKRWKPDQRIVGALAPIALDRVHGFSNPIAPEKSYARWLCQEWCKLLPDIYDRGYWSNLACPGFPFIIVHRLRDEIPVSHELGLKGWRVETFPNYGPQLPSMYVAAKLMWNHQADVDALLHDFYEKFFGPAAGPMGRYIALMDAALRDGDHNTGSAWDMPHFYPAPLRRTAGELIAKGRELAKGQGAYEQRVQMIGQTFEMLEAFVAMMDARMQVDFPTAQRQLERLDAVAEKLMATQPVPMLSAGRHSTYVNYMNRFFRPATVGGFQRVTEGNTLAAAATDEWDFQIDPARLGEEIGLWRENITGGNWQHLKTSSSSWSNQGLRYYKGLAWYRQNVTIPESFAGKRIFFWCGGVDEKAKVWVNGKLIGISHGASFYPFELDATPALRNGKNVITVCVANETVNELGTGGIVAPVILYAPAAGKDAQLDNGKFSLKETFP